jgi:hypothetical protein
MIDSVKQKKAELVICRVSELSGTEEKNISLLQIKD